MNETLATTVGAVRRGGRWFFGAPIRKQTYRNLCYLLLAFPLGVSYFVFLTVGIAVSVALTFVFLVGLPMLAFTLFMTAELAAFERFLAERLLRIDVPTADSPGDVREWLWRLVVDRSPWLGAVYLFSKFVIGTVVFVLLAFGAALTYALVSAPFHYREERVGIHVADPVEFIPAISYQHDGWTLDLVSPVTIAIADGELISLYVDSVPAALAVSAVGVLVGIATLHLFNALAWLHATYAAVILRGTRRSTIGRFVVWGEDDGGGRSPPGPRRNGDGGGASTGGEEDSTGSERDPSDSGGSSIAGEGNSPSEREPT